MSTDRAIGRLTPIQARALKALAATDAKVVGWDTSCSGPVVKVGDDRFALTPTGKRINRPKERICQP